MTANALPPVVVMVDPGRDLSRTLEPCLGAEGFQVKSLEDGGAAARRVPEIGPDLVILELGLPGTDRLQVLTRLRRSDPGLPVLVVTERDHRLEGLLGLRLGADDYVTTPFDPSEVIVRIEAILRRAGRHPRFRREESLVRFGSIEIDRAARIVRKEGADIGLAPRSFDLLVALYERRGRVASRCELLREVWSHRALVATRTVDTHIAELRKKLEDVPSDPSRILTVPKVGYRLAR